MQRAWSLFLILFLLSFGQSLYAQEEEEDPPESDWIDIVTAPYAQGDRCFLVSLGIIIPLYFSGIEDNQHGLSVGGFGSLSFNYFLTSNIFLGAEISGMFSGTRAGNMLYIIPFGARIGYQFYYRRFEVPVSLMIGGASQRYLEKSYFGPILKPGVSAFWRYNPDWSFGMNAVAWVVPQWPKNGNNSIGNFLELTLSARYHF